MTDVSVVVVAHDETVVAGPTVRAAEASIAAARAAGIAVQPVVALDAPTDRTAAYFAQDRFAGWERHAFAAGELAGGVLTRTEGRFVTFLRAGDLCSESWLGAAAARLEQAERAGERVIAHAELEVGFDGARAVVVNVDQGSPLYTPYRSYFRGCFDGLAMTPRAAGPDPTDAREAATIAAGWRHVVVPDTVFFRRSGDDPTADERAARASLAPDLPELAIDRIGSLGR